MRSMLALAFLAPVCGCQPSTPDAFSAPPQTPLFSSASSSFDIISTDVGFQAPAVMSAGTRRVVFENHGSRIHEAMLVKLPAGMSPQDYVAAVKAGSLFPDGALDYSGPGLTAPGERVEVWLKVDAGDYILICWNGDHATTTPVHPFTVIDNGVTDDTPPVQDVVLKLHDFRFELQGTLEKGAQVIRVESVGPSMHEVDIYRLHDGKTLSDLKLWRKQEDTARTPAMSSPADAMGGLLDSHDVRRVTWIRRTFTPGHYVLHCEMPMPGIPSSAALEVTHADVGMVQEFEIKP
ncbi:MAG: hypothetical protein ABIP49_06850 [Lysobacterales bacterium]